MITMPIRELLGEFNELVNSSNGEKPIDAYRRLAKMLGKAGLEYDTYAQSTITSGGHARNPDLSWIEVVKKNVALAQKMAEELYTNGQLNPNKTLEASTLGLINHWKESDYITFWLLTLARLKAEGKGSAKNLDNFDKRFHLKLDQAELDLATFNNYEKGSPERSGLYFRLAGILHECLDGTEYAPVEKLVAVSEIEASLGASTERYFAKKLGVQTFNIAIAHLGGSTLPADYHDPWLRKDTSKVVEFGGRVFDPEEEVAIMLRREQPSSVSSLK